VKNGGQLDRGPEADQQAGVARPTLPAELQLPDDQTSERGQDRGRVDLAVVSGNEDERWPEGNERDGHEPLAPSGAAPA
jgi:hypothetical protein